MSKISKTLNVLMVSEGILFRGPEVNHPTEVWDYPRKNWVSYKSAGLKVAGWSSLISSAAAEALKFNNPAAEHFQHFDSPPWSQPLSEKYKVATTPTHLRLRTKS